MRWLAVFLALGALGGCVDTTTTEQGVCPYPAPVISNATGLLPGIACTSAAQCKYGTCVKTAMQQGLSSTVGVCTKQCSCGGATSQCSNDNGNDKGLSFTCIAAAKGAGKECAVYCKNDNTTGISAYCQAINPNQPYCVSGLSGVFSTGLSVCASREDP